MYNIDYIRLIFQCVAEVLQKPRLVGFLAALISPIALLYNDFIRRRERNLYRIGLNGQVCYMEGALNTTFDSTQRRIYITDGNRFARFYIYTTAESKPKYLGTAYIHNRNSYSGTGVDFIVHMPQDLDGVVNPFELNALIDYCKLDSKRYQVEYE